MARYASYIICTSPRSGSTLLCCLLRETGVAGHPNSHFHKPSLEDWLRYYGLEGARFADRRAALERVFAAAISRGRGGTGVFGLRLQRHSFDFFTEQLRVLWPAVAGDRARMETAFGPTLFIHLTRENKLDQAISYVKATQTGLWHRAPDGTEIERLSAPAEPIYDRAAIAAELATFEAMDAAWAAWFRAEGIRPLTLSYDALARDPHGAVARILDALGRAERPADAKAVPVAKLADATNRDWAERFLAETRSERDLP